MVAVGFWVSDANAADTVVGGNLAWAKPLSASGVDSGWGFDARLGRRLNAEIITLTGELDGGYYAFGGTLSPKVYRGLVGARLGIGAILRPFVFGHLGLANASFSSPPGTNLDRTGFSFDAGGGIDFTLLPLINFGAYGAYNSVGGKSGVDALKWASVGLDAELVF